MIMLHKCIVEIHTECIKRVAVYRNPQPNVTLTEGAINQVKKFHSNHPGLGLADADEVLTSYYGHLTDYKDDTPVLEDVPTVSIPEYIPPVKLGDTIYWIDEVFGHNHINTLEVSAIHISADDMRSHVVAKPSILKSFSKNLPFHKFNKTWFLNRGKAEAKVEEMKANDWK